MWRRSNTTLLAIVLAAVSRPPQEPSSPRGSTLAEATGVALFNLSRWQTATLLTAASAALISTGARAQSAEVEGTVISLDDGDLVLDLGSLRGASDGDVVELWRPLKLRHPVTNQTLVDRFQIGSVKLTQVRRTLSLGSVEGTPARPPARGDVVILRRAGTPRGSSASPRSSAPAATPSASGSTPPPSLDPETGALLELIASLRGVDPEMRARRYETFAGLFPKGRYAATLREEAFALRAAASSAPEAPKKGRPGPVEVVGFQAPEQALAGKPLRVALEIIGDVAGAVLHVKSSDDVTYTSLPMKKVGRGYFAATIPGEQIKGPSLVYFIEGITHEGQPTPVAGTADAPRSSAVVEPLRASPIGQGDVTASLWVDYANYNLGKTNDYIVQTEGFFSVRRGDEGVRALRSGFGVYRGVGGTLRELDEQNLEGRNVGLTYGYLETELAPVPNFSLLFRGVIGLRDDGIGSGGHFYARIGNDRRTNLLLGGEFLGGIGLRGITQLEWKTIPRVPIVLRTEVTNQPAGVAAARTPAPSPTPTTPPSPSTTPPAPAVASGEGEVGARAIVQVGYELLPSFVLSVRASYQGRTIKHAGPGVGAAVTYQW